ncbi:MAG: NAD(+)/NADH kinase [Polyangiaceae bacterium]|nr:NAD(+)/NADH kinase [Polyangiaceae bacterium]
MLRVAGRKQSRAHLPEPARRVIVVAKRSSLSMLSAGEVDARAKRLLNSGDATVKKWKPAHIQHLKTLELVESTLRKTGAEVLVLHGSQAAFDTRDVDLVVTVGGDGTLLAASHNVKDTPILGVNSAPRYSVGFFCAARGRQVPSLLRRAVIGDVQAISLQRMAVRVNGQLRSQRILNEALFCHAEPAATSRYILQLGRRREEQRSSGIWISTAAGSTAAVRSAGGKVLPLTSSRLQLVVREPYAAHGKDYRLLKETLPGKERLRIFNKMHLAEIYLDGPYRKLPVRLGEEVSFERSDQPLHVLGLDARRHRDSKG